MAVVKTARRARSVMSRLRRVVYSYSMRAASVSPRISATPREVDQRGEQGAARIEMRVEVIAAAPQHEGVAARVMPQRGERRSFFGAVLADVELVDVRREPLQQRRHHHRRDQLVLDERQ